MTDQPEFSRTYRLDGIGEAPRAVSIEADAGELAALASRFGLISLNDLSATAQLAREGDVITASGSLQADAVQACVASGEPVPAHIAESFALRFVPPAGQAAEEEEIELEESELDLLTYDGGAIDLGEAVAQTLALALDPFPRAPDADDALREAGVVSEQDMSPFSALKALKDKL
jgi:uncharacterized metal-binding protein YceD (DUF177 family)